MLGVPSLNVKRDGVGGYASGQHAVVVDGWSVRDDVAASAYVASSLWRRRRLRKERVVLLRLKAKNAVLRARVLGPTRAQPLARRL